MSQPRRGVREKIWLAILMIAGSCFACHQRGLVPLVPRPDTRQLVGVQIDSASMGIILGTFRAAFPKEAALCLLGAVADTILDGERGRVIHITQAVPAVADSVDQYHVYFPHVPRTGCASPGLVAVAHDHTNAAFVCSHSQPDAAMLFNDRRLLVSVVFCANGEAETLMQDGRRLRARWAAEP